MARGRGRGGRGRLLAGLAAARLAAGGSAPLWRPACEGALAAEAPHAELCSAAQRALAGIDGHHWSEREQAVVEHLSQKVLRRCHEQVLGSAEECLQHLASHAILLLKVAGRVEAAIALLEAVWRGLPSLRGLWKSVWETPYLPSWNPFAEHCPQLRPPPGGWWDLESGFLRPVVRALRGNFRRVLDDFMPAREKLQQPPFYKVGGPLVERVNWAGVWIWSASARPGLGPSGWRHDACALLPHLCEALRDVLPTTRRPLLLSRPGEDVTLQHIGPQGFLMQHNDPERVTVMQCLTNCAGAWLKVGGQKRYFGEPGRVLAFDNIVDHSAGNDEDAPIGRWVINVVISHPDFEAQYEQLSPKPGHPNMPEDYVGPPPPLTSRRREDVGSFSVGEVERGLLGGRHSRALAGLRSLAGRFDCQGGPEATLREQKGALQAAIRLQHNVGMLMPEFDWGKSVVHLRFRFLRIVSSVPVPEGAMQEARAGCERLQELLDSPEPEAAIRELARSFGGDGAPSAADVIAAELPMYAAPPDAPEAADAAAARGAAAAVVERHLALLAAAGRALLLDTAGRQPWRRHQLPQLWREAVAERLSVMVDHLLHLQFLNAYAQAVSRQSDGLPPALPLLPPAVFHCIFADRVGVVLAALGSAAWRPQTLFVEVGVYNGSFALGLLRNSRMRYLGVDPYSAEGGSFPSDAHGQAMFASVSREILGVVGAEGRAELRRCNSQDAEAAPEGPADAVLVDGGHGFKSVAEDLVTWWPRLRPGGILFGHDLAPTFSDVPVALGALCEEVGCERVHIGMDSIFWIEKSAARGGVDGEGTAP